MVFKVNSGIPTALTVNCTFIVFIPLNHVSSFLEDNRYPLFLATGSTFVTASYGCWSLLSSLCAAQNSKGNMLYVMLHSVQLQRYLR